MGGDPNSCGCSNGCPPTTKLDPTIPGVTILSGSLFIDVNGVAGGSANGVVLIGLVGDTPNPGNSRYYGTDLSGNPGFFLLPDGSVTEVDTADSIAGGPITGIGTISLVNDQAAPGNSMFYGTDSGGNKGWFALPPGVSSPLTTKGDIWVFAGSDTRLAVGTDGQFLVADSTQATGLGWFTLTGLLIDFTSTTYLTSTNVSDAINEVASKITPLTAKGDLLTFNGTNPVNLPVGADNTVPVADSTAPDGIAWKTPPRRVPSLTVAPATPHLLLNTEEFIEVDASASAIVINLSLGATYTPGFIFTIKDLNGDAATNNITVNASGGQMIDGATSYIINTNYGLVSFFWNGISWVVTNKF